MLTAWGKKVVACAKYIGSNIPYYLPSPTFANNSPAYIQAKNAAGTSVYIGPLYYTQPSYSAITGALVTTGSSSSVGVAFGSDSTAATENDYTLGSQVTGLSIGTNPSVVTYFDSTNFKYIARLDYTLSNDTGSDITISEVGFFMRFATATTRGANASTTAANRHCIMIDRTVLDTPVTIPNGTAATVRYEFAYEG